MIVSIYLSLLIRHLSMNQSQYNYDETLKCFSVFVIDLLSSIYNDRIETTKQNVIDIFISCILPISVQKYLLLPAANIMIQGIQ